VHVGSTLVRVSMSTFQVYRLLAVLVPGVQAAGPRAHQSLLSVGSGIKANYPFYHNSAELRQEAQNLAQGCNGHASLDTHTNGDVSIDLLQVKNPGAKAINRVFMLCGEHSRELISPESCLHLAKKLCGDASGTLEHSEFQLVINANPRSRLKVEDGDYCLRENPNNVDLNRNWGDHYDAKASRMDETNPGPKAFSEPETQILQQLVEKFNPTTFLSIHSGTLGMYMPYAYDKQHLATRNEHSMMQVLEQLDRDHCRCPFGAAGKEVGYSCPGTSLDYVYDKLKAPYSFAFEIWVGNNEANRLRKRWEQQVASAPASLLEGGRHHLAHPHYASLFQEHSSDFVQVRASGSAEEEANARQCFTQYNPTSKEDYDKAIENWASVYIQAAELITQKLQGQPTNKLIV